MAYQPENEDYMSSDDVQLLANHVNSASGLLSPENPKLDGIISDDFSVSAINALQKASDKTTRLVMVYDQPKHSAIREQLQALVDDPLNDVTIVEFREVESSLERIRQTKFQYIHICIEYNDEFESNLGIISQFIHQNKDFLDSTDEVTYHINFDSTKRFSDYAESEISVYKSFLDSLSEVAAEKVSHCSILNKYETSTVYLTDRTDLTNLGQEIQDDIKHWSRLKILDYGDNCIRFLPGVKLPESLEVLNISGSYSLETLTGFKMPSSLKYLIACNNVINSLDNIKFPSELQMLDVMDNKIYFLNYVQFPPNLKQLNLSNNRIDNIRGIDFPRNLNSLNISGNPIDNLRGAKFPESLRYLDISRIPNDSMTGVKFPDSILALNLQESMTNTRGLKLPMYLKELNLASNGVNSINPLKLPGTIEILNLSNNNIKTLNKVQFPPGLKSLYLGNNMITTLKNVVFPSSLEILDLEADPDADDNDKRISSLKDVVFPNSLRVLKLGYQTVKSLESIEFPSSLTHFDLSYNELKLIRNVTFGDSLEILDLSGNQELLDLDQIFIPDSVVDLRIPSQLMHSLPAYIVERANKKELTLTKSLPF